MEASPPVPAQDASPSLLAYLFADRLIEADDEGAEVPCRGTHINKEKLSAQLMAFGFWSLRERGIVALAIHKVLFLKHLRPSLVGSADGLPKLESLIVVLTSGKADNASVGRTIAGPQLEPSDPWNHVIRTVQEEASALGLGTPLPQPDKKLFRWAPPPPFDADCAAIAAFEGEFEAVFARWEAFGAAEPDLRKRLVRDCKAGLEFHSPKGRQTVYQGPT